MFKKLYIGMLLILMISIMPRNIVNAGNDVIYILDPEEDDDLNDVENIDNIDNKNSNTRNSNISSSVMSLRSVSSASLEVANGTVRNDESDISWSLDMSGNLYIQGTGNISDGSAGDWVAYKSDVKSVIIDVDNIKCADHAFDGYSNLTTIDFTDSSFAEGATVRYMCANSGKITNITAADNAFDNIEDATNMCYGWYNNSQLDFSNQTFKNLKIANSMFERTGVVPKVADNAFDNVEEGRYMFAYCKLNDELVNCKFTKLKDGFYMFAFDDTDGVIDLRSAKFSNVVNCEGMFYNFSTMTVGYGSNIDLNLGSATFDSAESCKYMFSHNYGLKSIDMSNATFKNAQNCYYMFCMNENAVSYKLSKATFESAEDCEEMFYYNKKLEDIDMPEATFSKCKTAKLWAEYCDSIEFVNLRKATFDVCENAQSMFYDCPSLVEIHMGNATFDKCVNVSELIKNCDNVEYIDLNSATFNSAEKCGGMFGWNPKLTTLKLDSATFESAKEIYDMFREDTLLEEISLPKATFSSINRLTSTPFYACSNLKTVNLESMTLNNAIFVNQLFYSCPALEVVDLSNLNPSSLTNQNVVIFENRWGDTTGQKLQRLTVPADMVKDIEIPVTLVEEGTLSPTYDSFPKGLTNPITLVRPCKVTIYDEYDGVKHEREVKPVTIGKEITINAKSIDGYHAVSNFIDDNISGLSGDVDSFTYTPTEDIGLTFKYDRNKYKVSIKKDGSTTTIDYVWGDSVNLNADDIPNKIFEKWVVTGISIDDDTAKDISFVMPKKDVTVDAVYKDEEVSIKIIDRYDNVNHTRQTTNVVKNTAYSFNALSMDGYTSEVHTLSGTANSNKVLVFEYVRNKYRVDVNNSLGSNEYTWGSIVTITADTIQDKQFKNWTVNGCTVKDTNSANLTFTMPKQDVVVTANYKPIVVQVTVIDKYDGIEHIRQTYSVSKGSSYSYNALTINGYNVDKQTLSGIASDNMTVVFEYQKITQSNPTTSESTSQSSASSSESNVSKASVAAPQLSTPTTNTIPQELVVIETVDMNTQVQAQPVTTTVYDKIPKTGDSGIYSTVFVIIGILCIVLGVFIHKYYSGK